MLIACGNQENSSAGEIEAPVNTAALGAEEVGTEKVITENQDQEDIIIDGEVQQRKSAAASQSDSKYKVVEWTDLIPAEELEALLNPPEYLNDVEDGSMEDRIASQIKSQLDVDENDPYQKALVSTNVKPEMDGQLIKIPGFIVPLEFGENEFEIKQFFLVPFFGACIHVPPPPPNQIIFVDYPKGLKLEALYDPFWLSGKLITTLTDNDMATSAYSLELDSYEAYY